MYYFLFLAVVGPFPGTKKKRRKMYYHYVTVTLLHLFLSKPKIFPGDILCFSHRQQLAKGNKRQKQIKTFPVTFYFVKPLKNIFFWGS